MSRYSVKFCVNIFSTGWGGSLQSGEVNLLIVVEYSWVGAGGTGDDGLGSAMGLRHYSKEKMGATKSPTQLRIGLSVFGIEGWLCVF